MLHLICTFCCKVLHIDTPNRIGLSNVTILLCSTHLLPPRIKIIAYKISNQLNHSSLPFLLALRKLYMNYVIKFITTKRLICYDNDNQKMLQT